MKVPLSDNKFHLFSERMRKEGIPDVIIDTFKHYYLQLLEGKTGFIKEADIEPVTELPDAEAFGRTYAQVGQEAMAETVMIKLNGGLGTSMGLGKAKSLIQVKDGLNFLDIIARQAIHNRIPLLLMNSFATREDSLAVLEKYPELSRKDIGLDFLQHKVPKVTQHDLSPATWPRAPQLEWYPPGHGDLYSALMTSGMLDNLLASGYQYAFISNADNLGATLDKGILGYFIEHRLPFLMEVADRTNTDKKGGHLARFHNGQLVLRESAQCAREDMTSFQDISKHRYFNTNNLWLDLGQLRATLMETNNILGLSLIINAKTVEPGNPESPEVYQLETAMGSAISVFGNAKAVRVPRTRFAPVKTTNDLFLIRSDAYTLTEDHRFIPKRGQDDRLPQIDLDKRFFRFIDAFEARLPQGPPSVLSCTELCVKGDIKFGRGVTLKGRVSLENNSDRQIVIEPNTVIEG